MPPIVYVVTKLLLANHLIGLEKTSQSNMMILPRGRTFFFFCYLIQTKNLPTRWFVYFR